MFIRWKGIWKGTDLVVGMQFHTIFPELIGKSVELPLHRKDHHGYTSHTFL